MEEKQMKLLILVRHGDYSGSKLTSFGREDIASLAEKLRVFTGGAFVHILTSTAGRARESADILGHAFGVQGKPEPHEILWSEEDHPEDLNGALELVREYKGKVEVLILVTHYEYVESFPAHFAKHELGTEFPLRLINKGEAWVIDCQQKKLTHVR